MGAILGLLDTEDLADSRFKSIRRQVFYFYPNGSSPLVGLLSLLQEEQTNDPEFSWFEKRLAKQTAKTEVNGTTSGFWYADSSGSLGAALGTSAANKVAGTVYWIRVDENEPFRNNHILEIRDVTVTGGTATIFLKVLGNTESSGNDFVRVTPIKTLPAVTNAHTNNANLQVMVIGSAYQQGAVGSSESIYHLPKDPSNACQIFRNSVTMTGTALKTSVKYDESGAYEDKATEASIDHMREMEFAFLFGEYSKTVVDDLPQFTTRGVLSYLKDWEAGTTYGNEGASTNADDEKRILDFSSETPDINDMMEFWERLFRVTNNVTDEKLVLCGNGYLLRLQELLNNQTQIQRGVRGETEFGMRYFTVEVPTGVLHYKTHPLFNHNPVLRNNAMHLDVLNLRYRFVEGRDTELLKNREPNDADFKRDEWLTESGLEMRFPESAMYHMNLLNVGV